MYDTIEHAMVTVFIVVTGEDWNVLWMDAQRDGVTFTPRHGKAVEINALWHHGLLVTAEETAPS